PHHRLEIGVAGATGFGNAAGALNNVDRVPGKTRIVEDLAAWGLFQHTLRNHAYQIIAFHEAALVVVKEAAVEIAIPCNSKISAVLDNSAARFLALFRQKRIGHAVGEAWVRL